ncbi:hypothetical protein K501DRAFT_283550 [Backusella circina FSU 941]|nr:hypothetical protein K501DRAFT_283550 [Backusella circina FSU 941]
MSNSFGSLLRNSRLASYDRSINQVYTTSAKRKAVGDWGLKRNLPNVIRTRFVNIQQLDTAEHQTPWQSGESQVMFVHRWKENFPQASKRPMPRADQIHHNIVQMTPAHFRRFLKQCAQKEPQFQAALKKKTLVPEQVFEYLNVSFTEGPAEGVVGPTYAEINEPFNTMVEGRILNAGKRGHNVGIGGVVAFLPRRGSDNLRHLGDRKVRTFYVESASLDEQGKPSVVLTVNPPGASSIPFVLSLEDEEEVDHRMSASDMFLTRRESIGRVREEDKMRANPDHENLMNRIAGLIQNTSTKN